MTAVAAGIKALLSGAKVTSALARKVNSSEALQARFDESAAEVNRDIGQVSYAVCKALVAHALGRAPSDQHVQAFMTAAVSDPSFPNRAFRLLGEARKAASRRRRAFLAAVLFGLPFAKMGDDERDRVDVAVERLTVPDVEFLSMLAEARARATKILKTPWAWEEFGASGVLAIVRGASLRIGTPDVYDFTVPGFPKRVFEEPRFVGDSAALAALVSTGCIDLGPGIKIERDQKDYKDLGNRHHIVLTALGDLVLGALEEVRAGFDGVTNRAATR